MSPSSCGGARGRVATRVVGPLGEACDTFDTQAGASAGASVDVWLSNRSAAAEHLVWGSDPLDQLDVRLHAEIQTVPALLEITDA
ncbi:hypothetical protein T484DRAFT_1793771, partial [Baffinella frigidus]